MRTLPSWLTVQMQDIQASCPVDVGAVADRMGLAIHERNPAQGVPGALVRDENHGTGSGFVICVDDSEAHVRQRSTAAHEISQVVLHPNRAGHGIEDNFLLRSDRLSNDMEKEAKEFEADLLMPFRLIARLIRSAGRDLASLARTLTIPEIAMGIRPGHSALRAPCADRCRRPISP